MFMKDKLRAFYWRVVALVSGKLGFLASRLKRILAWSGAGVVALAVVVIGSVLINNTQQTQVSAIGTTVYYNLSWPTGRANYLGYYDQWNIQICSAEYGCVWGI